MAGTLSFREFVQQEAALSHADGCTGVTNINGWPCLLHDLEFRYGKSATDAWRLYQAGVADYWAQATSITFEEANAHFKAANFRESWLGYLDPQAWARWMARRAMRPAWDAHRKREQLST